MSTEIEELFAALMQLDEPETPLGSIDATDDLDDVDPLETVFDAEDGEELSGPTDRHLSHGELTLILHRIVLPALDHWITQRAFLNLGNLARAAHRLQGSEWHLERVRKHVQKARVPIFAARSDRSTGGIQLSTIEQTKRYFGDLVHGEPDPAYVIERSGYAGLRLSVATRAFLVKAWQLHCLSRAEEQQLMEIVADDVQQHGMDYQNWSPAAQQAREQLVLDNLWLVGRVARKYVGIGIDLDDLLQAGHLGLLRAVEKQDPARGTRFVIYASNWIYQGITRFIADHSSLIRLPVHVQQHRAVVESTKESLYAQLGRPPSLTAIAAACTVDEYAVRAILVTSRSISLDMPGRIARADAQAVRLDDDDPLEEWSVREQADIILAALAVRERLVLEQRFGLVDGVERTLAEIGEVMKISRERVRQIEGQALHKLRQIDSVQHSNPFEQNASPEINSASLTKPLLALAATHFSLHHQALLIRILGLDGAELEPSATVLKRFRIEPEEVESLQSELYLTAQQLLIDNPLIATPILITHEDAQGKKRIYKRQLSRSMSRSSRHQLPTRSDLSSLVSTDCSEPISETDTNPPLTGAVFPLIGALHEQPSMQVVEVDQSPPAPSTVVWDAELPLARIVAQPTNVALDVTPLSNVDIAAVSKTEAPVPRLDEPIAAIPPLWRSHCENHILTTSPSLTSTVSEAIAHTLVADTGEISPDPSNAQVSAAAIAPDEECKPSILAQLGLYDQLIADAVFGFTTGVPLSVDATAQEFGVSLDQVANVRAAIRFLLEAQALSPSEPVPTDSRAKVDAPVVDHGMEAHLTTSEADILPSTHTTSYPEQPLGKSSTEEIVPDVALPVEEDQPALPLSREQQALATFEAEEAPILDLLNGITGQHVQDTRLVATHFDLPIGYVQRLQWKFERRLATIPSMPEPPIQREAIRSPEASHTHSTEQKYGALHLDTTELNGDLLTAAKATGSGVIEVLTQDDEVRQDEKAGSLSKIDHSEVSPNAKKTFRRLAISFQRWLSRG